MRDSTLHKTPVTQLKGVGPKVAERLQKLGIHSVQDVLFHLPYRYQDRTKISPIGALRAGMNIGVVGFVQSTQIRFGRRRSLVSMIDDDTGRFIVRLFHFSSSQKNLLANGRRVHCFGEVRKGPNQFEMIHPEIRVLESDEPVHLEESLTPSYPTTEGLHQLSLRKLTEQALEYLNADTPLPDFLPTSVTKRLKFPTLNEAIQHAHRPPPDMQLEHLEAAKYPAQQRLAFEELLAQHLSLRLRRQAFEKLVAPSLAGAGELRARFLKSMPFQLTAAQQRVTEEISADLKRGHPMHRLVQGDVGSGKTVVAAVAALQAIEAGYQVAFMAPTELLAEQHLHNFQSWLEPLGIKTGWLSGKVSAKARREVLSGIEDRSIPMVVGTHALFQETVVFANLALIIVDEQHRFGVHQRLSLLDKGQINGSYIHQLIMTATPIPRTLAMAAYADLDTSVIDELPPGRQPVDTAVVSHTRRDEIIARIDKACAEGRQAYWVCTLIEESEALQCEAAVDTQAKLQMMLPTMRVELIHGRLKSADKQQIMADFKRGEIDLLVATTVIEVGVDVPNASLMIIENAERLGLAQLHQLRGRVGRGEDKSVCVLLYQPPLSTHAKSRLNALRKSNDGFEIARIDLEIRGPGELLGTRQTGLVSYRVADMVRDQGMLPDVERTADTLLEQYPENIPPLVRRWLGDAVNYANV